ncbi:MAG: hypothetical protein AB1896_23610, partial [Thermodesulfobacteriota bacterium]
MERLYRQVVHNLRSLMARILEPRLDLDEFLGLVSRSAKELKPDELEARVYEVDFIENVLILRTSTKLDAARLSHEESHFAILPRTITGDAIIENKVVVADRNQGYAESRFKEGHHTRAA